MKSADAIKWTLLLTLCLTANLSLAQNNPETEDPERWQQNYLLTLKDAYLLDAGRARVSLEAGYWENMQLREYEAGTNKSIDRDQYLGVAALELGLTQGLQFDVALPFGYAKHSTGTDRSEKGDAGDIRTGLTLQLAEQDHASWLPTLSFRGGGIISLSNAQRGFDKGACGWEAELLASKAFDDFFWHGNLSYRHLSNTREYGQSGKADEQLWKAGLGLVYSPKMGYEVMVEASYGNEREDNALQKEYRESCYITPGFNINLSPTMQLGAGIPIGVAKANYDWALVAKLQIKL